MDIADFSLDLFSLAGRNALVTGGNTGLGRAFSVALATAGADVFAVGLAEDDGTTRALIERAGRRMEFAVACLVVNAGYGAQFAGPEVKAFLDGF